jgi:hypothetical protein
MEERADSKEEETIGAYYLKKKRTLPSGFGTMMMTATAQFFLFFSFPFFLLPDGDIFRDARRGVGG